ncbi:MAG: hypothetical protein O2913_12215 [Chloroflexi bacterium]|nr:hypothetical protein [Chloroflexota bacterium]
MLRQKDIVDTLALGCEQGYFVLRLPRPDRTFRTLWRTVPTDAELQERDLEVVLPEAAELSELDSGILQPGAVPGLWPSDEPVVAFGQVVEFFDGKHVSRVQREGYEEPFPVPAVPRDILERTVTEAVNAGVVWLISGPASVFKEDIPLGVLTDAATLYPPPQDIPATALLPQNLEAAWAQEITTAAAIANALSVAQGKQIPWPIVSVAIDGAIRGRLLERTEDSGPWPCDWPGAASVRLRIPIGAPPVQPPLLPPTGRKYAEAEMEPAELQDLVDGLGDIVKAGAGLDLRFVVRVELSDGATDPEQVGALNEALAKASSKLRLE